jgi:16S rRNA (guanine(527)-N(7))-methyltransferase RsmG
VKTFRELLAAEFSPYGTLSVDQLAQLERHYELLLRWNKTLNLTRIRDMEEAVCFHYCESLFLGKSLPPGRQRIIDVGSGAGFPGFPVALLRPDCSVDLVESHQRKAVFLREATDGLHNVRVLAKRAEDCEAEYNWMIARGVCATDVLSSRLAPNFALLMSAHDADKVPGINRVEPTPWGERRVLATFHVEHGKSNRDHESKGRGR